MTHKKKSEKSPDLNQKSLGFLDVFSKAQKRLLKSLTTNESDDDRREKQEVYLEIAKALQDKFHEPLSTCMGATYILCQETDSFFLNDELINQQVEELQKLASSVVLSINVRYEPFHNTRTYKRQIEIFFIDKDRVSVTRLDSRIDWDFLPPDVRENQLRHGKAISAFELYSQES